VRFAIASTVDVEAPRSWTKDERAFFATLPIEIQAALTRREADRDRALRNAQNKIADEHKRLKAAADTQPAETHGETTMAKKDDWSKGEGPYAGSSLPIKQVASVSSTVAGKIIVDNDDNGFPPPMPRTK